MFFICDIFVSVLLIFKRLLASLASTSASSEPEDADATEEFLDLGSMKEALDNIPTQTASSEGLDTLYTDISNMNLNDQSADITLSAIHQETLTNKVKEHFPTQYQIVLDNKIAKLSGKTLNSSELMKVTYETIILVIMSLKRKEPTVNK